MTDALDERIAQAILTRCGDLPISWQMQAAARLFGTPSARARFRLNRRDDAIRHLALTYWPELSRRQRAIAIRATLESVPKPPPGATDELWRPAANSRFEALRRVHGFHGDKDSLSSAQLTEILSGGRTRPPG